MKQLVRKPLLLSFMLSLPLWVALDNYVIALGAGLLLGFLVSMGHSLWTLNRREKRR